MDHGRTDVAMPQQFLDRPDVAAVLEQVGSERVAQRVTGRALRYSRVPDGLLEGSLDDRLVKMMPTALAGHSVDVEASGGKHPLPDPLPACVRILACQCPRKLDPAGSLPEIDIMLLLRGFQVASELRANDGRKRRSSVFVALAAADGDHGARSRHPVQGGERTRAGAGRTRTS